MHPKTQRAIDSELEIKMKKNERIRENGKENGKKSGD